MQCIELLQLQCSNIFYNLFKNITIVFMGSKKSYIELVIIQNSHKLNRLLFEIVINWLDSQQAPWLVSNQAPSLDSQQAPWLDSQQI